MAPKSKLSRMFYSEKSQFHSVLYLCSVWVTLLMFLLTNMSRSICTYSSFSTFLPQWAYCVYCFAFQFYPLSHRPCCSLCICALCTPTCPLCGWAPVYWARPLRWTFFTITNNNYNEQPCAWIILDGFLPIYL